MISNMIVVIFIHTFEEAAIKFQKKANKFSTLSIVMSDEKLVLIDSDAGTDDAWALFMSLAAHNHSSIPLKILGITCTHGNTKLDNVTVNVTRTLQTAGEESIPIYRGSDSALAIPWSLGDDPLMGQDGFGDADLPPLEPILEAEHAVDIIIQMAEQHKGKLTILALGPLTNLAAAVRRRPDIKNIIKEIYILGGNHQGMGNTTVSAEFNFMADPEAAHVVLENYSPACPLYIIPWETCLQATSAYDFRVETLASIESGQMELLNKIEAKILDKYRTGWKAPDAVAAALLIEPTVITKSESYYCMMELCGTYTRGMMIVDKRSKLERPPNCTIITEIDMQLYEKMILWTAGGPFYKD